MDDLETYINAQGERTEAVNTSMKANDDIVWPTGGMDDMDIPAHDAAMSIFRVNH